MRYLLTILLCGCAFAQIPNVVQSSGGASTAAMSKSVTSGDLLVCASSWETSVNTPTVSDTLGSTWTQVALSTANTVRIAVYKASAASTGADTCTFTVTGAAFQGTLFTEFNGVTSTVDQTSSVTTFSGTPATITSGSITPAFNKDLCVMFAGGFRSTGNFNSNAGETFVELNNGSDSRGIQFKVCGTSGSSTTESMTNANNDVGSMVLTSFKAAAAINIVDTAVPDAVLNQDYGSYCLRSSGGAGSLTWSLNSGSLQPGLSLNSSTGCLTGTPTNGGTNAIVFHVTDGTNTANSSSINLKVSASQNTPAHVQDQTFSAGVATFSSNVTAGNLITVWWRQAATVTLDTCTDSLGTSFAFIGSAQIIGSSVQRLMLRAGIAPSTGADSVTCTTTGSALASEYSNLFLAADNIGFTAASTNSPITSSNLLTLSPNEELLSAAQSVTTGTTLTVQAPFTQAGSAATNPNMGFNAATTITNYTVTYTQSANGAIWGIGLIGLRPTGGAAAPVTSGGAKSQIL